MAEHKKSFILYADLIGLFETLPNEIAGKLIKIIFQYVNDQNPKIDDLVLRIAFEPIKQILKRDLVKWEGFKIKQSENGKLGGRPKKAEPLEENPNNPGLISESQKSLSVSVSDSVSGSVIDINSEKNKFLCYDVEKLLTINQGRFEKICMTAGLNSMEAKKEIHLFHLYLTKENKYPNNEQALFAGAESWLLNTKKFNKNTNGKYEEPESSGISRLKRLNP